MGLLPECRGEPDEFWSLSLLSYLSLSIIVLPFLFIFLPIIFSFHSIIHYSFILHSEIYIVLFFVFPLFFKGSFTWDGWQIDEHFQLNVLFFFIYFYCRLETLCWHAAHEYVPCSLVFSSECWHSHGHICHREAVQLNRLEVWECSCPHTLRLV